VTAPAAPVRRPRTPLGAPVPYAVLQAIRAQLARGVPCGRVASNRRVALAVVHWAARGVVTGGATMTATSGNAARWLRAEGGGRAGPRRDRGAGGNAEFIAHARTDVPALVERVRALEAERDAVRAEMVEAQSHHESAADEVEFQCQRARALEAENARLRDDLTAAHLLGARGKGALEDRMQRAAAHLHVGAIGAALKELEP
jgi:hypothetical protein